MYTNIKHPRALNIPLSFLLGMSGLATFVAPAKAVQEFYVGSTNGAWNSGNNWDGGTVPAAGDDAVVGGFVPGRIGDVNVTFDSIYTSSSALSSITLDTTGTNGSVIVNQTASGSSLYATSEYIGNSTARNVFNQSAGTNIGQLYLGYNAGGSGVYNLSGNGTLGSSGMFRGEEFVGVAGNGSLVQSGGTNYCGRLEVGNSSGTGLYKLSGGAVSLLGNGTNARLTVGANGTFNQSAGTNTVNSLFSDAVLINAGGSYNLSGGSLSILANNLSNNGTFNLSGGTLSFGNSASTVGNNGIINVSGSATITGAAALTNNSGATVRTASTAIAFTFPVTTNGAYQSTGGSTQTFTTLTIGTTGSLQGGSGEVFDIGRNLTNNSAQNSLFDLAAAHATLSGDGVTHRLTWTGADLGSNPAGYVNNFSLGTLELTANGSLALLDGDSTPGGAVYIHALLLDGGLAQIANIATSGGLNLYYDPNNAANGYLLGQTYPISGGGFLAPAVVPEPGSLAAVILSLTLLGCCIVRRREIRLRRDAFI